MSIDAAYAEVERLTRREARNFAYGIRVLPRDKRQAISAVYAFARRVDDIADGGLPAAEKRQQLENLREALDRPPADATLVALGDARSRFGIPEPSLHALVDGGLQDTEKSRYASFEELHEYCRKVAGAVGVACVAVYGSADVEQAETLGVSLQLINIIRDVREDMLSGMRAATEPYALLKARIIRERFIADWGVGESGATGPTGNRYGDAAGHAVFGVAGPLERSRTLETGHGDRVANMYAFAAAGLDFFMEVLESKG